MKAGDVFIPTTLYTVFGIRQSALFTAVLYAE